MINSALSIPHSALELRAVDWIGGESGYLKLIDQTKLSHKLVYINCTTVEQVAYAIRNLQVRGAPAIGVAAAFGAYLGIRTHRLTQIDTDYKNFYKRFLYIYNVLLSTRPTAVNLKWALERIKQKVQEVQWFNSSKVKAGIYQEALKILKEDRETCNKIGLVGAKLIKNNYTILTHCNAGLLATAGNGTALSVLYQAKKESKKFSVFATETRPLLQGARLTVWELQKNNIPVTLICDNMVGSLMQKGKIDLVIVGADRIARNGDTANKIGTYQIALLVHHHKIPFYIAAPLSTFDRNIRTGNQIPIEYRSPDEVTHINHTLIAPRSTRVYNPAFDVTPAKYITGFITEIGIIRPRSIIRHF
ncbi:MAG: S-methyl-5-thioribose-1-phosphate isomerase [Planctomycetota bacterium]